MFYVLNFEDHTFMMLGSVEGVKNQLRVYENLGVSPKALLVVYGNWDNCYTPAEFIRYLGGVDAP